MKKRLHKSAFSLFCAFRQECSSPWQQQHWYTPHSPPGRPLSPASPMHVWQDPMEDLPSGSVGRVLLPSNDCEFLPGLVVGFTRLARLTGASSGCGLFFRKLNLLLRLLRSFSFILFLLFFYFSTTFLNPPPPHKSMLYY